MGDFCYKTAYIWQIVGYVLLVLKIIIPIIIIIFGIVELGKATVSSDDKLIGKSVSSLIKRVVAGIVIFFIPTLINVVFALIFDFAKVRDDYINCVDCLTSPNDKCDDSYKSGIFNVD